MASSVSPGSKAGSLLNAPGGTGPGLAQPLKNGTGFVMRRREHQTKHHYLSTLFLTRLALKISFPTDVRLSTLAVPMSSNVFKLAALAGDGIGPEVMRDAIKVLRAVEKKFSLQFEMTEAPVGWAGIDAAG